MASIPILESKESLANRSLKGVFWSFIDSLGNNGIQFIINIILARLLLPSDFGIVGIIVLITSFLQLFTESGFSSALIRKDLYHKEDYSTIFVYSMVMACCLFLLLFLFAPLLAFFFNSDQLIKYIRVSGLLLILNAVSQVHRTILTKEINFKKQALIYLATTILSGSIAIFMALTNFGIWALVLMYLLRAAFSSLLLILFVRWKISLSFNFGILKSFYSYSSKIMLSNVLNFSSKNIIILIIGKFFTPATLGFYTRADQFKSFGSEILTGLVSRVSFPIFARLQNDKEKLRQYYLVVFIYTFFLIGLAMLTLAIIAHPLVLLLLGNNWITSIYYLQLLTLAGITYPLIAINASVINALGHSQTVFKVTLISNILNIIPIILGIKYGIPLLIISLALVSFLTVIWYWFIISRYIDLTIQKQLLAIWPSVVALTATYFVGRYLSTFYQNDHIIAIVISTIISAISFLIFVFFLGPINRHQLLLYIRNNQKGSSKKD